MEVREFSPAASNTGSRSVPRWFVWPMRPFADEIVGSTKISPAKSQAPYMPRCTRSHRSSSNSRNICLPTARTAVAVRPSRRAAPSAKRPCGLDADVRRPTKLRSNWRAIRWTE
jgi:hypothetical protein